MLAAEIGRGGMMETQTGTQNSRSVDPVWFFLAEYAWREGMPGPDPGEGGAGLLCQTMLELGIPPEWVENIEMTLTGFAREALAHFKQGRPALPERIRVFCQKKMVAEKMSGGWGYFLIERTESPCDTFAGRPHQIVDLYLYREG